MKRLVVAGVFVALACAVMVGCGKQQSGGGQATNPEDLPALAGNFADGQHAFWGGQEKCPVCGKKPLKQKHHADVQSGRIYFDKAECVQTFKKDKDKYVNKLKEALRKSMSP